ncbi:PaaI family thioesterase [Ferrimonas pelagia]|uniref:PaaI family thioesterase n=1 Tax=Ferrimonas pelagia TaxID=1177826 RepID=A0ABP9EI17_9GAMM
MKPDNRGFFPLTGFAQRFVDLLAQCRVLGIKTLEASEHHVLLELPYHSRIVGYPDSGVIHGGVITTLMDTGSGAAVLCAIRQHSGEIELSPTLDLRVDYMKPAEPGLPVYGFAECYKLTSAVAFTRAIAYQHSMDEPIAQAVGSFMRIGSDLMTDDFRRALEGG